MGDIIQCYYCGNQISHRAQACPQCQKFNFIGNAQKCLVCNKLVLDPPENRHISTSVSRFWAVLHNNPEVLQRSRRPDITVFNIHDVCLQQVEEKANDWENFKDTTYPCPTCGFSLGHQKIVGREAKTIACPSCGEPLSLVECTVCRNLVLEHVAVSLWQVVTGRSGKGETPYRHIYNKKVHPWCKAIGISSCGWSESKPLSSCFIASAVYAPDSMELIILRSFRDDRLKQTMIGRSLIAVYEYFSPPIASVVAARPFLKTIVKKLLLEPIINIIDNSKSGKVG